MTDTATKIKALRDKSHLCMEEAITQAGTAIFQAGMVSFTLRASDQQLMRSFAENAAGNSEQMINEVTMAPAVLEALLSAIETVEKELLAKFAVVGEQG